MVDSSGESGVRIAAIGSAGHRTRRIGRNRRHVEAEAGEDGRRLVFGRGAHRGPQ
ncbi:hypothetical protein [Mycobacterium sp. NPDC050041]|uniref:hypothetical protein n=1 Tax=Mycobacterium sp. NPDC050041 TaxID=3364293 RepID=UPI003C2F5DE2